MKFEPIDYFLIPITALIIVSIKLYNIGTLNILIALLLFWNTLWLIYNKFIRIHFKDPINGDPMSVFKIDLPKSLKGHIRNVSKTPEMNNPDDESINGWSIGHIMIYLSIGLFIPNSYTFVILISLFNELYEYAFYWRSRWLVDPTTNMLGYILGRFIVATNLFPILQKPIGLHIANMNVSSKVLTLILSILLILSIYSNKYEPEIYKKNKEFIPNQQSNHSELNESNT
jgi:hypothetical protein